MIYRVLYTSWNGINFYSHRSNLGKAAWNYNRVSAMSKNPKQILSLRVISKDILEVVFFSHNMLSPGREANALWYFSHDLVENQGFRVYLSSKGKLMKSA